MVFGYRVSEAEYRIAGKLYLRTLSRLNFVRSIIRSLMISVFILFCLMLLWTIIFRTTNPQNQTPGTTPVAPMSSSALVVVISFLTIGGLSTWFLVGAPPARMRRMYRNDPMMQGEFTLEITQSAMSIKNTAGTTSSSGWNIYESWSESRDVIILALRPGAYFILSLSGLGPGQRDELRSILTAALPRK